MNRVVHFEIQATDPDVLETFYKGLFDWDFTRMGDDYGGYRVIVTGPGPDEMAKGVTMQNVGINGGLMKRSGTPSGGPGMSPNAFTCIVGVDNVDATVTKATELGGQVALPAMDVPKVGRIAYLIDPDNNLFGIITPEMP